MRVIKDWITAQKAINELLDFKSQFLTGSLDLHGNRITNAGTSVDANDYVTKAELPTPTTVGPSDPAIYTITFPADTIANGYIFPPFVAGKDQAGYPQDAWISVLDGSQPSGGDLTVNFTIDGVTLLNHPLKMLNGTALITVHSSDFVTSLPKIGKSTQVTCTVITASGAANFSAGLVVQRFK